MADSSEVVQYVEAASASNSRGRTILIVMIVTSVVAFSAYWNSRQNSWLLLQYSAMVTEYDSMVAANQVHRGPQPVDTVDARLFADRVAGIGHLLDEQSVLIHIPFFGIAVHVNDLGMLGGFAFTVLLLWFSFNLFREAGDLRLAFAASGERNQLKLCRDLLVMRQFLTITAKRWSVIWAVGWLPRLLFTLPLLVQSLVFVHDCQTRSEGMRFGPEATTTSLVAGGMFLVAIFFLTLTAFGLSWHVDTIWQEQPDERGSLRR